MVDVATLTRLDGRVALVAGASRGIGRAIAESLVTGGAAVCVNARKSEQLDETVEALAARGGTATAFVGSAADPATGDAAVAHCLSVLGRLDILVNCVATNPQYGPLVHADPGATAKVWETNVQGPLCLAQSAWRSWMGDHGGVMLNLASLGGLQITPMIGAYNVSKAALIHLTRQLAMELAPTVRVNALAPAVVKTRFARTFWEGQEAEVSSQYPLRRLGTPEDVAAAAVFLVSDAASWITGQTLVLDGGVSLLSSGATTRQTPDPPITS